MMNINVLFLSFVFLFTSVKTNEVSMKTDNFGPYDVVHKNYQVCRGPKAKNVAHFSTNVTFHGGHSFRTFNYFFPERTTLDEVKVQLYSVTGNTKKKLYNYKLNQPCTHYFAAAMIKTFFNSSDCVIEKGTYEFMVSPEATARGTFGPKFFYGDYLFKSNMLSKQGNIMCLMSECEVVKKT